MSEHNKNKSRSKVPKDDRHFITSLARGLEILRVFFTNEESLSNIEMAKRSGLPKSTITRYSYTLVKLGYLQHIKSTGRYRLGLPSLSIGGSKFLNFYLKEYCKPLIQDLALKTNSLIALGSADGLEMFYLEAFRGNEIITVRLEAGSRIPIHSTSMGRAYLSAAPGYEQEKLFTLIENAYKGEWPEIKRGISNSIQDLKKLGCCCSFGDWNKDVNGIAVPINLGHGLLPMVLSSAGASSVLSKAQFLNKIRPELLKTAQDIEKKLGLITG